MSKKNNIGAIFTGGLIALQLAADVYFIHRLYKEKKELNRAKTDDTIRENDAKAENQKDVDTQKTNNDIKAGHEATKDAMELHNAKTQDDIERSHVKTADNIEYDNAHTDNLIRMEEARSNRERRKTEEAQQRSKDRLKAERERTNVLVRRKKQLNKVQATKTGTNYNPTHPFARSNYLAFYDWYFMNFGLLQELSLPPMLKTLIAGCPLGFEIPALFTILSVLGAYVFSGLRANYHGTKQSPTILVVIEGEAGSGKGMFKKIHEILAKRFMEREQCHYNDIDSSEKNHIVQTLSVKITKAKYAKRLSINGITATFMICEEIDSAKGINRGNGLGEDYIRLSFDNGMFEYDNCGSAKYAGRHPIHNNFVLTGTPQTVAGFIKGKVESGDASRIIWADILNEQFGDCQYNEPFEIEKILDELDTFHNQYTITTDTDGNDVPCQEKEIDLSYVQSALAEWSEEQKEKYKKDNQHARPDQYRRISTIAFRCAMVLHALWGFPKDEETQQKVVTLTKYLANYIMERYIYKFGHIHNKQSQSASPKVSERGAFKEVPDNVIADWVRRNKVLGADGKPKEGYGTFAKEWNNSHPNNPISKDTVKRRMDRYKKNHPEK